MLPTAEASVLPTSTSLESRNLFMHTSIPYIYINIDIYIDIHIDKYIDIHRHIHKHR